MHHTHWQNVSVHLGIEQVSHLSLPCQVLMLYCLL